MIDGSGGLLATPPEQARLIIRVPAPSPRTHPSPSPPPPPHLRSHLRPRPAPASLISLTLTTPSRFPLPFPSRKRLRRIHSRHLHPHPHQARPLGRTDLELIFQRANIDTPARPASRSPPSRRSSPPRPTSPLEDQPLEGVEEDDDDGGDGGTASLVIREFVCALVRVAWSAYPRQRGVEAKMCLLLEGGLTPFWQAYEQQQEVGFDFEQVQAYGVGG